MASSAGMKSCPRPSVATTPERGAVAESEGATAGRRERRLVAVEKVLTAESKHRPQDRHESVGGVNRAPSPLADPVAAVAVVKACCHLLLPRPRRRTGPPE
jgi:hypothetical protein